MKRASQILLQGQAKPSDKTSNVYLPGTTIKFHIHQRPAGRNTTMTEQVLEACKAGINIWQQAFNSQDAAGCTGQYVEGTTMVARPFGTFTGREQIQAFWQSIMDQGFADVDYTNVEWIPEDDDGYILTASWTMNKAYGVVHREHWKLQNDGKARLEFDEFEVQGER